MDEEKEEGKQTKGGMGLADGEGTKDISDQIESQDQFEDAQQADQPKPEDEKDYKVWLWKNPREKDIIYFKWGFFSCVL